MIYICSNNRRLIISSKNEIYSALDEKMIPCVVLLYAWNLERAHLKFWEEPIRFLLDRGCTYFVCIGQYSEDLHDAVDNYLYQYDEKLGVNKSKDVVTTYHPDGNIEDSVNFFVHATELRDKSNGYLVAIVENENEFDANLRQYLTTV